MASQLGHPEMVARILNPGVEGDVAVDEGIMGLSRKDGGEVGFAGRHGVGEFLAAGAL